MESKKLRMLTLASMLAAVGYVLQLFEFPLPFLPAATFLKFDFGDIPVVIAGSMFGPGAAVLTATVKGLLWALIGHGANSWVGAGMNTIAVIVFALPLALLGRSRKLWVKAAAAGLGMLAMTAVMVGLNLIVDPLYFKWPIAAVKAIIVPAIIPFNLFRGAANGVASVLVMLALQRTAIFRTSR
ncbi:ECF transporter S component [Candidatus Cryosericum terrychapinii]|uniref:Riboflavin transporter n=1 Tax=Candidatus Cryosericum terrychapinii TaxID=2290919 RepID=A0A398D274_9BACT|nr:ECF transporter S component [Candidatus Cryosericum terrychapinii]RIE06267.1 ECF transporter S component [Candidatus Cryosericum terrychapinii]